MKEGWSYKKLGEVCEILDSKRKPITKEKREAGDIPYYGATGCLDFVKNYIFDEKLVLLGEDGAKWGAGEESAYIIEGKSWVNNHAHTLRPKRSILIDEFMVYYLNYSNLQSYITGVTVPKLNQEKMRSIEIPVPPLSEQHSIVARLDAAFSHIDALKANAEKQLNEARKLFQAKLTECMKPKEGWEEKTLPKLSENLDSIRKPVTKKDRTEGIYPYYGASGIVDYVDNYLFDEDLLCISEDGANLLMRTYPIAFPISGKAWVNNHAHVLRFKCMSTQRYVEYYFAGLKLDEYITGAAQPKLTQKALNSIIISIPSSLAEQSSIVSHLDSLSSNIRKLEELQQKTIAECDALKQAMLKEVFE